MNDDGDAGRRVSTVKVKKNRDINCWGAAHEEAGGTLQQARRTADTDRCDARQGDSKE